MAALATLAKILRPFGARQSPTAAARRKFLRFFPRGFRDAKYLAWERDYKWQAHLKWQEQLGMETFAALLREKEFVEIGRRAVRIESRTNLLFSFEKMALRDALREPKGSQTFSKALYEFLHGSGAPAIRFERWVNSVASLPRKQTRVLTWPLVTVFGFLAQPQEHFFLKPNVTRRAFASYGVAFDYQSKPDWDVYAQLLARVRDVKRDLSDLHPRDLIDIQSFLWVLGSDEYD